MNWVSIWGGIKGFFSKAWEAIKKLPHWAVIAFLLLFAFAWWLIQRSAAQARLTEIQREVANTEKDRAEAITEIHNTSTEEEEAINAEFEERIEELREEERIIMEAASEGPVAVANEWKEFLSGRKEK
tara:strand:- start:9747 stop:10130 length:384 start_codon:yes stop_codon:yes gene_type:complete